MKKWLRIAGVFCTAAVFSLNFMKLPMPQGLPDRLYLQSGEAQVLQTGLPLQATLACTSDSTQVQVNGQAVEEEAMVDLSQPLTITADGKGEAQLTFKVAGMTVRNMTLLIDQERTVQPGGQCVGVAMYTKGALVVGTGDIANPDGTTTNPGTEAGIEPGDVIIAVNGQEVEDADHLGDLIAGSNTSIHMTILRDGREQDVLVTPVQDAVDGKYRVGLWVRDSTAGIGTITYTDPQNNTFASLGHPISDVDTNENLLLKRGEIVPAEVMEVIKGEEGQPGELCGAFVESGDALGKILKNCDYGLYGKLYGSMTSTLYPDGLPLGWQSEVEPGPATILCTVDGQTVQEYTCEIVRATRQRRAAAKGMVVEITDPRLLAATNGIVQGMSGSPLIQNGKLVGAVTHVFVGDPHRGYAIYIEWMLNESDNLS